MEGADAGGVAEAASTAEGGVSDVELEAGGSDGQMAGELVAADTDEGGWGEGGAADAERVAGEGVRNLVLYMETVCEVEKVGKDGDAAVGELGDGGELWYVDFDFSG